MATAHSCRFSSLSHTNGRYTRHGNELLRKLRRLAKRKQLTFLYEARPGKGGHGRIYIGERFTTIPALTHEVAPGLLTRILRDLGLTRQDPP